MRKQIFSMFAVFVLGMSIACTTNSSTDSNKDEMAMVALAAVATATRNASSSTFTGSCNSIATGGAWKDLCGEYNSWSSSSTMSSDCSGTAGTFSTTARCTTSNYVGTCTYTNRIGMTLTAGNAPAGSTMVIKFYSPTYSAGTAQSNCNAGGGTFTP